MQKSIGTDKKGKLAVPDKRKNPVAAANEALERMAWAKRQGRAGFMEVVFEGAREGKWSQVLSMVGRDLVNERDRRGRTLLMLAAMQGDRKAMEGLVEKGAFKSLVDDCERSALVHAMLGGKYAAARWLRESGVNWKGDLEIAVRDRRKLLVRGMIDVLGVTGDDIAEAEAKFDPKRGPALSSRVKRVRGSDAAAVRGLELLATDDFKAEPGFDAGEYTKGKKAATEAERKPHTGYIGEIIC
jgi:hypothetical protein